MFLEVHLRLFADIIGIHVVCLIEVEEEVEEEVVGSIRYIGVHLTLFVWLANIIGIQVVCLVEVEAEDIGSTDYIGIADIIRFYNYSGIAEIIGFPE